MPDEGMEDHAIWCRGLSKRYGDVEALKELDMKVPYGAILAFWGAMGRERRRPCGCWQGWRGRRGRLGRDSRGGDDQREPESPGELPLPAAGPAFYNWMTPLEYLDHVGRLFGMAPGLLKKRIDELLSWST